MFPVVSRQDPVCQQAGSWTGELAWADVDERAATRDDHVAVMHHMVVSCIRLGSEWSPRLPVEDRREPPVSASACTIQIPANCRIEAVRQLVVAL